MQRRDDLRLFEGTDLEETERLLFATRDEPEPLTLAGFAHRTADRAMARPRFRSFRPWRWLVGAAGAAAAIALWWQGVAGTSTTPQPTAPPGLLTMHEETVDYEFALDALDEADLAALDRWLDQDPT